MQVGINRLVIGEANRFPETGRIFYERAVGRTHDLLAGYIAGAMVRGLLRRDEPQRAAQQLIGLCSHGYHQRQLLGLIDLSNPELFDDDAEHGVATFLRAYAPSIHRCDPFVEMLKY